MRSWMTALAGIVILSTTTVGAPAAAAPGIPAGFELKGTDTYVHRASGTEFPMLVVGFTRDRARPFDIAGKDVAVSYRQEIGGHPVIARIAMIQIVDLTPKEHYLGMKSLVGSYYKGMSFTAIQPQGEGPFTPKGMNVGSGYQGRFKAMQGDTPYELSLSTVKLGAWDVRLTAAYPAAAATEARKNILRLAATLKKTGPAVK
ncbi:MAG: hypothetical protein EON94_04005 [Caulobacteraceae bacterium]|nr:MAG: hypothetical protein EON94_04005 [Caulobacteraceae bacterium]